MRRRKRRSSAALSERALKDIRKLHSAHLREISAILSNTLGFPVRVSLVPVPIVDERPRKRGGRVSKPVAEVAGYGESPLPAVRLDMTLLDRRLPKRGDPEFDDEVPL